MRVWDLPLRLFHWLLVVTVIASYVTGVQGGLSLYWHSRLGAFLICLIVFRFIWGFAGSTYARFASFMPTPARWHAFLAGETTTVGHSPLAALAIFALLGLAMTIASFGLFAMNDDIDFHGPLYDLVSSRWNGILTLWHVRLFNVLIVLIGLHLAAMTYYAVFKSKNLVAPMEAQGGGTRALLQSVIAAVNTLAAATKAGIPSLFTPDTEKGKGWKDNRVKPEFFKQPEDVKKRIAEFGTEVTEMTKVANSGDVEKIKSQFDKLQKSCKNCHDDFRAKE